MRGRKSFTSNEIHGIEHTLRQLRRADRRRQRRLRELLRREYRFYISDFASNGGAPMTADDVEQLISQGVIRVR